MMQGPYPFNEAAFKIGLRKVIRLGLLFSAVLAAILFGLICEAQAQTAAENVFGGWVRVTPETILTPVPDWHFQRTTLGAVTNEYRKHGPATPARALPLSPPVAPEQVAGLTQLPERR